MLAIMKEVYMRSRTEALDRVLQEVECCNRYRVEIHAFKISLQKN